ncbi:uncharacterized protein DS421_12g361070 [Arachis hypogaea]|nr:uncharacterized protein DS421_12g361070 [Arachis hypogaea]
MGDASNKIQSLVYCVVGSPLTKASSNGNAAIQTRHFLGCGDGEKDVLSKIYEEKRILE